MQFCMDPRDEARLLLGPQSHITQVGPAAQSIAAARLGWGMEGVEVTAPAAPYTQQLETGQHGGLPLCTTSPTSAVHSLSYSWVMHPWASIQFSLMSTAKYCA